MDGSSPYVDLAAFKQTLSLTGQSFADQDIAAALIAASRGIDEACDRRFWSDTDATQVRYYTPRSWDLVPIDDLIELGSVKTDMSGAGTFTNTLVLNTDFVLKPLNADADDRPWTRITRNPRSSAWVFDPCQPRSVKVTGRFGWSEVPPQIEEATTILAAKLLKRSREAPFGVVSVGIDGAVARIARTDPDIGFLIDPFTRPRVIFA